MRYQYIPYLWALLASAVISTALGSYAARHRTVHTAPAFALCMLAITVWTIANALEMAGLDLPTKIFWANVQYLPITMTPILWNVMTLQLTNRGHWVSRHRLLAMCVIPVITNVLIWTNPWHGWMRQGVHLDTAGPFPVVGKTYGPWFWVHTVYSTIFNLTSLSLLARALIDRVLLYRRQVRALFTGLVLIFVVNVLYFLGLSPVKRHDLTPVFFGIGGLISAWGLFRHRFFDVVPIARATVVERMDSAVGVLDTQNRIIDLNPAAEKVLGCTASQAVGRRVEEVLHNEELIAACKDHAVTRMELAWGTDEQRFYEIYFSNFCDKNGRTIGRLIVAHDVTENKLAQVQLRTQQQALLVLEERERLARELHDSLGQVLGYVNVQAQAVREMLASGQTAAADSSLCRLFTVAQEAHTDVREFIHGVKAAVRFEQGFLAALQEYIHRYQELHGIRTEVLDAGGFNESVLDLQSQVQLIRIIQEALTNVRKHANAGSVWITLSTAGQAAVVMVEDDGTGFVPPAQGGAGGQSYGLQVMRERAAQIGGAVRVDSSPGRGTKVVVTVPFRTQALHRSVLAETTSGMVKSMRVLLVDDHALFREGLQSLLATRGYQVVGTACDGVEALEKARALQPDVILMDIQMPRCNGLAATRLIKAEMPAVRIVILTMSEDDEHLFEAIKSGASGYLLKNLGADALFDLLAGLARGEAPLSPGLAAKVLHEFARQRDTSAPTTETDANREEVELTPRQAEILALVSRGLTYKEVGASLYLSERTIKYHMGEIVERLHLKNRHEVLAYAKRMGLAE
ncbi:MAG: histidine kinase N-terminal 7TM domain-containing protein [Bacteroidota bacterium]